MKNLITLLAVSMLLFTTACKKDNASKNVSSWKLGDTTYKATIIKRYEEGDKLRVIFWAEKGKMAQVNLFFSPIPTKSGKYKIVSLGRLNEGEIAITAFTNADFESYRSTNSTDIDRVEAEVTISKNKLSVILPPIYMQGFPGASLSAELHE